MKIIGDNCKKCDGDLGDRYAVVGHNRDTSYMLCGSCWPPLKEQLDITQNIIVKNFIQPERSKREDLDCYKCRLIKDTIELPICNHTNECDSCFGLLKLIYEYKNKMRCSEHYREGNEG